MTIEQQYFIDIIGLMPEQAILYIQAPSLEYEPILNIMHETIYPYYRSISLEGKNRALLLNAVKEYSIQEYFQSLEIWNSGVCIFKGYDGVEIGDISKEIELPESFTQKYILKLKICGYLYE